MSKVPPVLFMDGGLGTTLADQFGYIFDDSTPLWSSQLLLSDSGAETIQNCHSAFVDAGADLIITATYQASINGFYEILRGTPKIKTVLQGSKACAMESGKVITNDLNPEMRIQEKETTLEHSVGSPSREILQAQKCMRIAVKIARTSFKDRTGTVVLGLGAAGACLKPSQEYTGNYAGSEVGTSVSSIRNWHSKRLRVFSDVEYTSNDMEFPGSSCWNEIDLIAFETIPLVQEIIAVREAMFEIFQSSQLGNPTPKKDFWVSCVFPGDEYCLPDGSSVTEVLRAMIGKRDNAAVPMGVGINCTFVGKLEMLVKKYETAIADLIGKGEAEKWPSLVIYPDGTNGEVYNTVSHDWEKKKTTNPIYDTWDKAVYDIVSKIRCQGAWESIYVGGCCRTTPDDIKKLRMNWLA